MMYRYAKSRTDAKNYSRRQTPTAALSPALLPIKCARPGKPGDAIRCRPRNSSMRESSERKNGPAGIADGAWWSSAAWRAAWFACLWLVVAGANLEDISAAAAAVAAATWTSLRLLEPNASRRSPRAIVQLVLLFLYHSIVAGADVARRALDPRLPLCPGFVAYPTRLSPGMRRNVFTTLTSLLPGTVPTGEENGQLLYHCLDVEQPVLAELATEEAALVRALYND
jgi:multicomponent Na+:H+ antiporter subunit E